VYYQHGLLEKSLDYFKRALKNFIVTSGQQHLSVARTYYKIAVCYLQQNQPESVGLAMSVTQEKDDIFEVTGVTDMFHSVELEKALEIYEQKPMHVVERARCLFALHEAQIKAGRADQMSSNLMQALTLRRTHLKNIGSLEQVDDDVVNRADFDKLCSITGR
jgi:tetratricopeptide (TPR) repeat protein